MSNIDDLKQELAKAVADAGDLRTLEAIRIDALGK